MKHKVVLIFDRVIYAGYIQTDEDGDVIDYDLHVIMKNHNDRYVGAQRVYLSELSPSLRAEIMSAAGNSESADVEGWLQIAGAVMLAQAASFINGNGGKLTANLYTTEVYDCQQAVNDICADIPKELRPFPMQMNYSNALRPKVKSGAVNRASNAVPVDAQYFVVTTVEQIEA